MPAISPAKPRLNNNQFHHMIFRPIRAYDNYITASIELSLLKESGITCHLKDEFTVTIDPLLSPALGGMKLMVAEEEISWAQQLLADSDKLYLQTIPCPSCSQKCLDLIIETTYFNNWKSKIRSLIINGQEQQVNKFYRCAACLSEFKELPQPV